MKIAIKFFLVFTISFNLISCESDNILDDNPNKDKTEINRILTNNFTFSDVEGSYEGVGEFEYFYNSDNSLKTMKYEKIWKDRHVICQFNTEYQEDVLSKVDYFVSDRGSSSTENYKYTFQDDKISFLVNESISLEFKYEDGRLKEVYRHYLNPDQEGPTESRTYMFIWEEDNISEIIMGSTSSSYKITFEYDNKDNNEQGVMFLPEYAIYGTHNMETDAMEYYPNYFSKNNVTKTLVEIGEGTEYYEYVKSDIFYTHDDHGNIIGAVLNVSSSYSSSLFEYSITNSQK